MFNIAICDDEAVFTEMLNQVIEKRKDSFPTKITVDVFNSGKELYDNICSGVHYDMIFMDICMPEFNGIEIGHKIRDEIEDNLVFLVYISSVKDYVMDLFDVQPLAFMLKPFEEEKVEQVILKAIKLSRKDVRRFKFEFEGESIMVEMNEIIFFEAKNKRIYIHLNNERCYDFRGVIKDLELRLKDTGFFRPHNAYLVNIEQVERWGTDHLCVTNGEQIPIAQTRRAEVKKIRTEYVLKNM